MTTPSSAALGHVTAHLRLRHTLAERAARVSRVKLGLNEGSIKSPACGHEISNDLIITRKSPNSSIISSVDVEWHLLQGPHALPWLIPARTLPLPFHQKLPLQQ